MKMYQMLNNAVQYMFEAAVRVFSPNDDQYPELGIQPFEGDPYYGSVWAD